MTQGAADFWQAEPGWVLLDFGDGSCLPVNDLTERATLVCDDAELDRVVAGMRSSGCPVRRMPRDDGPSGAAAVFVDQVPREAAALRLRPFLFAGTRHDGLVRIWDG